MLISATAAIVGEPDPLAPSADETALLRQNDIVSRLELNGYPKVVMFVSEHCLCGWNAV